PQRAVGDAERAAGALRHQGDTLYRADPPVRAGHLGRHPQGSVPGGLFGGGGAAMTEFDTNLVFVVLMFATFIALLFTGYPLAFVLGGVAVMFAVAGEILNTYFDVMVDVDVGYLHFAVHR